jgi:hypothetical protein
MTARARLRFGIAGLMVGLVGLAGCEGGGGEPLPETGGAGIPGVRGPVSSKMPQPVPGKAQSVTHGPGPAAPKASPDS